MRNKNVLLNHFNDDNVNIFFEIDLHFEINLKTIATNNHEDTRSFQIVIDDIQSKIVNDLDDHKFELKKK